MTIAVQKWTRRSDADREEFAMAALEYCKALKKEPGVQDARFYCPLMDTAAVLAYLDSPDMWNRMLGPHAAEAAFRMSDLGRETSNEVWFEARAAQDMWEQVTH